MTSNHILLYRIAELMFEYEQHILPVDLIFDDKQIGDFAKSIQIDSPYQQMLLEGILTESFKDEKLYVSFTVEGYFHYVLGEVIENKYSNKKPEFILKILRLNSLAGIKQGVDFALTKEIYAGKYKRLIWLIDHVDREILPTIISPATNLFTMYPPRRAINLLLKDRSENDYDSMFLIIKKLEYNGRNILIRNICNILIEIFNANVQSRSEAILMSKCLEVIRPEKPSDAMQILNSIIDYCKNQRDKKFLYLISYHLVKSGYYDISIPILKKLKNTNEHACNLLGICYYNLGRYSYGLRFFSRYHIVVFGRSDMLPLAEAKYNMSTCYWAMKKYTSAFQYINESLQIEEKILGKYDMSYIVTLFASALQYRVQGMYIESEKLLLKVLEVANKTLKYNDPFFLDLYMALAANSSYLNNTLESIKYYEEAKSVYQLSGDLKQNPDYYLQEKYYSLAVEFLNLGNFSVADEYFNRAICIYESISQSNDFIPPYMEKANLLRDLGDHIKSAEYYYKAIQIGYYSNEIYSNNPSFWIGIEYYEAGLLLLNNDNKKESFRLFELSKNYLLQWSRRIRDKEWRDYVKSVMKYIDKILSEC